MARVAGADRYVPSQAVMRRRVQDVNDLCAITHAHVGGKTGAVTQRVDRLAAAGHDLSTVQIIEAEQKHSGAKLERVGVRKALQITVSFQRIGQPECSSAGELQGGSDLWHGDYTSLAAKQRQDSQSASQGRHDVASLLWLVRLHHLVEILQVPRAARRKPEHPAMLLKGNVLARFFAASRPFNKQHDIGQLNTAHGICT